MLSHSSLSDLFSDERVPCKLFGTFVVARNGQQGTLRILRAARNSALRKEKNASRGHPENNEPRICSGCEYSFLIKY